MANNARLAPRLPGHWNLLRANSTALSLFAHVDPALLSPPVNVLKVSLHPAGLAPRIVNLAEWRHHILSRLREEADRSLDPVLSALHDELKALPENEVAAPRSGASRIAVPLVLRDPDTGTTLSFLSTTTVFGTATDITLSEITLECFFPADEATRHALKAIRP
jgi:hypothetical protein